MLSAVAETIFPAGVEGMPSVEEAQVVAYLDDILFHLDLKEKVLIRGLLALLEVQTVVFNGTRPCLFTQATPEERTKNIAGWESSRIFQRRLVFMAIRTLLLWAYVDSQEVEAEMGFVAGTARTDERKAAAKQAAQEALDVARGIKSPRWASSPQSSTSASKA